MLLLIDNLTREQAFDKNHFSRSHSSSEGVTDLIPLRTTTVANTHSIPFGRGMYETAIDA
jgi:hypothetical protein